MNMTNKILIDRAAVENALDALERITPTGFNIESDKRFYSTINAFRTALMRQKSEPLPVAYIRYGLIEADDTLEWERKEWGNYTPLYTRPPNPEQQEKNT